MSVATRQLGNGMKMS